MRHLSHSWLLTLALSIGLWNNAIANPPPIEGACIDGVKPVTQPKRWYGETLQVPVPFFLNRSPADFYQLPQDEQPIKPAPNYPLGTLFFAVAGSDDSQPNHRRVGFYSDEKQCFTALPGWVDKSSLLQGIEAMRVSDAVRAYPQLGADKEASCEEHNKANPQSQPPKTTSRRQEMTCDNRLFLRALSRPEFDFKPRQHPPKRIPNGTPDGEIINGEIISEFGLGILKHLWRYVYAIDEFDGQLWYLLGHSSYLTVKSNITATDVNITQDVQDTLLGWIPQSQVTEWATNVALEYNTERQALKNRVDGAQPARLYVNPREDAKVLAVENLALAQPAVRDGRDDDTLQVRFDPFGLDPMLPRYYVKSFNKETGWYQVATIGTSKITLSDEQLRAIMTKLRRIIDDLIAVDLVFVVDRSDSMANVIAAVRTFLDELCQLISETRRDSHFVIKTAGGGQSISTSLDIKVSLVAYAEESETIFSQLKLPEDREEIFRQMTLLALGGKNENMYGALHKVINDSESLYWRKHALRSIILLTDEPNPPQKSSQLLVESALIKATEKPAKILAAMGEESQLDYRVYTPIWALFTPLTKSIMFRRFKESIRTVTYMRRIVDLHVKANGEEAQRAAQRQKLTEQIAETIGELQNSINSRLRLLANRLTVTTPKAETAETGDTADAKKASETTQTGDTAKTTQTGDTADAKKTSETTQTGDTADAKKASETIAKVESNTLLGLETAFKQHGITAKDINALNDLAFVEGYANKQYSYHKYPNFREVIVIEARELYMLHSRIQLFVSELDNAFTRFSVCDPKSAMAAALFQALAYVSGNPDWLQKLEDMNTRQLCQYARQWLMGRELENQTIAELSGVADILPVSKDGLLGMEKREFRRLSPNQMGNHHNILASKVLCMNNILNGRTVPNDIKSCQTHRSREKPWYNTPVGSTNKYIYLPRHLVP